MARTGFFRAARIAVLAATALSANPARAVDLDYCINSENDEYLCGTAIEFGAFAASLRDVLLERSRALVRPGANKVGGRTWTGLAAAGAQGTSGNFSGSASYALLGADTALSAQSTLGLLVNFGQSRLTVPSSVVIERKEILAGPMFATALGNGSVLAGQVLYGRPSYELNNVPSSGESLVGSLIWSRPIARNGTDLTPFAALSVKREWPNGTDRVEATILTFGTSLDGEAVRTASGTRQLFGRVEVDLGNYADTLGNPSISYVAPRLGVGARFAFDGGGALQVQANASVASDQTVIMAAQAVYRFEF